MDKQDIQDRTLGHILSILDIHVEFLIPHDVGRKFGNLRYGIVSRSPVAHGAMDDDSA